MVAYYLDKEAAEQTRASDDGETAVVDIWTSSDIRKILSLNAHNPTDEQLEEVMKHVAENYHSGVGLCNAVFENAYLELVLKQLEEK